MFADKKIILFDMDGTLIDSVGIWNDVDRLLIERLAGQAPPEDAIQARRDALLRAFSRSENAYLDYCSALGTDCGSSLTGEEILALRYEIARHHLIYAVDYKPRAEAALRLLRNRGLTLAIATTTRKSNMDIYRHQNVNLRRKAPPDQYFSLILTREDVRAIKPHPEVYLKALEKLQARPQDCLVFEDSLAGVEAARQAGLAVAALYDRYSDSDRSEINRLSDVQYQDYAEVIRAVEADPVR